MPARAYFSTIGALLDEILATQLATIKKLGGLVGQSIAAGGIIHLFGAGHSHLVAEEAFIRAGTLTTVRAIWPQQISDKFERVEGLGNSILKLGDVQPGEILFVISNSGINPMPIDVTTAAQAKGAKVVAITSVQHSKAAPPRHSSKKRLFEVADYVLDTCIPPGDAVVQLPELPYKVGPTSTICSMALVHSVLVEATQWLTEHGHQPPVRISRNLPGGDAHNDALGERYRHRIPELG